MSRIPQAPSDKPILYAHVPHPHEPVNVNMLHKEEHATAGFNQKIAIVLTKAVGTMVCAYIFAILAIIGWPGLNATPSQWVQWISQTFIQLVMLSVIMVGQSILGRKQELQSQEMYETTVKSFHDVEQIMQHLSAQDGELLRQTKALEEHTPMLVAITHVLLKAAEKNNEKDSTFSA